MGGCGVTLFRPFRSLAFALESSVVTVLRWILCCYCSFFFVTRGVVTGLLRGCYVVVTLEACMEVLTLRQVADRGDGFCLTERVERSGGGWLSLKLTRGRGWKRNWWLGWNGERLACNSDAARLCRVHPEVYDWVVEVLAARLG